MEGHAYTRFVPWWRDPKETPPSGRAVIAAVRVGENTRRVRAMYLADYSLEGPEMDDHEFSDDFFVEDEDGERWWPEGWYEATAVEPSLTPMLDCDLIGWTELPRLEGEE